MAVLSLTGNPGQDAQTSEESPFSLMATLVLLDTYFKGFPLNILNSQLPFLSPIPKGLVSYVLYTSFILYLYLHSCLCLALGVSLSA